VFCSISNNREKDKTNLKFKSVNYCSVSVEEDTHTHSSPTLPDFVSPSMELTRNSAVIATSYVHITMVRMVFQLGLK
jgi:hypothetical protein